MDDRRFKPSSQNRPRFQHRAIESEFGGEDATPFGWFAMWRDRSRTLGPNASAESVRDLYRSFEPTIKGSNQHPSYWLRQITRLPLETRVRVELVEYMSALIFRPTPQVFTDFTAENQHLVDYNIRERMMAVNPNMFESTSIVVVSESKAAIIERIKRLEALVEVLERDRVERESVGTMMLENMDKADD
jgi:hypothetical protein